MPWPAGPEAWKKHHRRQCQDGRDQEQCHQQSEAGLGAREASVHDHSDGHGTECTSEQEEGNQVGWHARVIAHVIERDKAQFSGARRTGKAKAGQSLR